ncbi:formylglycine-generating enzyme family protein [Geminisphaera colitermitum]|uniref:formylglycine-generating enzyme family protein n=1 Tax=Geminisphaera colitermitum TaxID=1148786 RepID=UPI0006949414|nr:SUMF1/EgtB/PvdO family nonheme iron enzyme [Geminisphaera colitermitum]
MKSQKQNDTVTLPRVFLKLGATAAIALLSTHLEAASSINIPTVTVGDIGNAADSTGYGAVSYEYQIGKYQVTNGQYAAFLNAVGVTSSNNTLGLYNSNMDSNVNYGGITWNAGSSQYEAKTGWENKPVNYVTFYDAARFVNWLTTGDTENGLYVFSGATTITSNPDHATSSGWAVASEDEWYKAAYYNGDGTYREYPVTGTLSQTTANYYSGGSAMPEGAYIADVDFYDDVFGAGSTYGTFQQGGNVYEWNDTFINGTSRVVRGGAFDSNGVYLASSARLSAGPATEGYGRGFRVSLLGPQVPEPEAAPATLDEPVINGSTITINVLGTPGNYYALYASQNLLGNAASWGFVAGTTGQFDDSGLATLTFTKSAATAEFYRVVTSASPLDGATINADSKFSHNVGGVYDVTVAAKGKAYVANQLVQSVNTVATLFDTLARGSSVGLQNGTTGGITTVTKSQFNGSWGANGSLVVDTGTAVEVSNYAVTPVTLSFSGVVATGTRTSASIAGINTHTASPFPVSASTEDFGITRTRGDVVTRLQPDGSALTYTVGLNGQWGAPGGTPVVNIGEGFLFRRAAAATWSKMLTLSTDSMEITW